MMSGARADGHDSVSRLSTHPMYPSILAEGAGPKRAGLNHSELPLHPERANDSGLTGAPIGGTFEALRPAVSRNFDAGTVRSFVTFPRGARTATDEKAVP